MGRLIRLRAGEWIAGAGGVALIVALLAWEPPIVIAVVLAAIAVLALALGVLQVTQDAPAKPLAAAVLAVVLGFAGVVLVAVRLIVDGGATGGWIALAATAAITIGGWRSLAVEHVRGLPPDPEPELRPAPGLEPGRRPQTS